MRAMYRLVGVDGNVEIVTLRTFIATNRELPELDDVKALKPGETYYGGGGAAPTWSITRLAEEQGAAEGTRYRVLKGPQAGKIAVLSPLHRQVYGGSYGYPVTIDGQRFTLDGDQLERLDEKAASEAPCAHTHPPQVPTTPCDEGDPSAMGDEKPAAVAVAVAKEQGDPLSGRSLGPKPIVIEKLGDHKYQLTVKGEPLVKVTPKKGKPLLTYKGRSNYVAGSPQHFFKTKDEAEGIAHMIGRYILDLGDFVYTYVEYRDESARKMLGASEPRLGKPDAEELRAREQSAYEYALTLPAVTAESGAVLLQQAASADANAAEVETGAAKLSPRDARDAYLNAAKFRGWARAYREAARAKGALPSGPGHAARIGDRFRSKVPVYTGDIVRRKRAFWPVGTEWTVEGLYGVDEHRLVAKGKLLTRYGTRWVMVSSADLAKSFTRIGAGAAEGGAVLTTTLRSGTVVLAKLYKGKPVAITYANRAQADKAAARVGGHVIGVQRPYFVVPPGAHGASEGKRYLVVSALNVDKPEPRDVAVVVANSKSDVKKEIARIPGMGGDFIGVWTAHRGRVQRHEPQFGGTGASPELLQIIRDKEFAGWKGGHGASERVPVIHEPSAPAWTTFEFPNAEKAHAFFDQLPRLDVSGSGPDGNHRVTVTDVTDWPRVRAAVDALGGRAVPERARAKSGVRKADKDRWDALHARMAPILEAARQQEIAMRVKYGDAHWRDWSSKGDQKKLEQLRARADKIGEAIVDLLVKISPRGEGWLTGAPAWWIREKLTWEDAIRPKGEKLSVEVPAPWGSAKGLEEPTGPTAARQAAEAPPCIPWVRVTRDVEKYEACVARAKELGPIDNARDVYKLMHPTLDAQDGEAFFVILLDVRQQLRGVAEVARGQRSKVTVAVSDIMRIVLTMGAEIFVVCHAHPSGDSGPSDEDVRLTKDIEEACKPYAGELTFADHVVIGLGEFYSIREGKRYTK